MAEGDTPDYRQLNLISAAAHDIKTPLVFIRGAASELKVNKPGPEELTKQLDRIEQSAARLLTLVDSLIGSAQSEQVELALEPAQANQVIDMAIADIYPYANQLGFKFNLKVNKRLPPVLTNRLALRRVIFNLLDNAIKYTQDRKQVDIRARQEGDKVEISIRDYGVGIRPEDIKKIWQLFGRASEPTTAVPGSSGLGLYIASTLSQKLSVELDVQAKDKGTAFFLRLPIATQLSLF